MKASAVLRLKFPSKRISGIFYRALKPEVERPATSRSKISLGIENEFLVLSVVAKDTVALRASLNAYLRWIQAVYNVIKTLGAKAE